MLVLVAVLGSSVLAVDVSNAEFNVNYDQLKKNDDKLAISHTVTLTNSGTASESLVYSLSNNYGLVLDKSTATVEAGATAEVTISGDLPVDLDGGFNDVATLKITDSSGEKSTVIKANVRNMIELDRIRVLVNDNEEKIANEDAEEVKDINPGDQIALHFRLENLFDEDYREGDIEGEIKILMEDDDFGDDIDQEESYSLDSGDKISNNDDEIVFSFDVPLDVKEGTYTMEITLDGSDENNADYEEKWDLDFKVERDRDDLRVEASGFTPQTVSCVRNAVLNVDIINFGRDRQKNAVLAVEQTDLGVNLQSNFDIAKGASSDNVEKFSFPITVDANKASKEYDFTLSVFYDLDKLTDKKFTKLKVSDCAATAPVTEPKVKTVDLPVQNKIEETVEPVVTEEKAVASGTVVKTVEETPYSSADIMVGAIVIAMVLMLAVIMLLVIVLLRR